MGNVRICGNFCGVLRLVWRRVGGPSREEEKPFDLYLQGSGDF